MKKKKLFKSFINSIKLAIKWKYSLAIFAILIIMIAINQVPFIISLLSSNVFNILQNILETKNDQSFSLNLVIILGASIFLVEIVAWIFSSISQFVEVWWRNQVNLNMKKKFLFRDFINDIGDFDNPSLIDRRSLSHSVDPVKNVKTIISFFGEILLAISFATVLWNYNPWLIPVSILSKIPLYWLNAHLKNKNTNFQIQSNTLNREKNYFYNLPVEKEVAKEFRIFNFRKFNCSKYEKKSNSYLKLYQKKYSYEQFIQGITQNYDTILLVTIQIVIGISVFKGNIQFGTFTLIVAAFTTLSNSVEKIINHFVDFRDVSIRANAMDEYFEEASIYQKAIDNTLMVSNEPHSIEFRNVNFSYPGTEKKVLNDINLKIEKGMTCAFVGLNGSGKSTLINLLLRLYEPNSGEILLDGVSIDKYNIPSYYEKLACVFQSTTKYSIPIVDYITDGRTSNIDEHKIKDILKRVGLLEWCETLPKGIYTMLTRKFSDDYESVEPSIGQWQKLSIARAIYKESPLLILDEPSASLDVDIENEIFNDIKKITSQKTAILTSHRLSNVIGCDMIFLIDNGKIVEKGTHFELLKNNGVYADMFLKQAKYYGIKNK